jgi:gamma-glutamyltranspeptidase/glutathione hydrolase
MTSSRPRGVVAAGHPGTAEAGAAVLRAGGNAIDAAIAAVAMACVCEPVLASPGGGGFAMVRNATTGELSLIDFFPHTPKRRHHSRVNGDGGVREIHTDFGTALQAFLIGPATTATPGFPAGVAALHRTGASWSLADIFEPARAAALDGVTVTEFQNRLFHVVAPILTATDSSRRLFAPSGDLLEPGETLHNPGLAHVFDALAAGDGSWIDSPVGKAVLDHQRDHGHLRLDDLTRYRAEVREPLSITAGDATVHLNPLPAAGGVLIAHSLHHVDSTEAMDMARAFRLTARARADAKGDLAALSPVTLRQKGTTHVSVIDAEGNACAVTVSNGEGNGDLVEPYGFMLNNILGEDDVNPAGTDAWPPDTRLSSMMCPTIIEHDDGSLVALGSGGSNRIRTAMAQVIARRCLDRAELVDAVHAPRIHVEGEHLDFEDFFGPEVSAELTDAFPDHLVWPERNMFYGGVHAAALNADGGFVGAGDPRRAGHAIVVD